MNCPGCGKSNPTGANFCSGCGKQIPKVEPMAEPTADAMKACPRCGHMNPSHVAYCGKCGVSVKYDLAMHTTDDAHQAEVRSKNVVTLGSEATVRSHTQKPTDEQVTVNPDELVRELDNIWASIDSISRRLELLERKRS